MTKLAISPCPNDTFAFYALLEGKTSWQHPLETRFADIEELNHLCMEASVDICKISFHAWLLVRDQYALLQAGSALGSGCGPLVVARPDCKGRDLQSLKIAVPGRYTTATLLLQMLLGRKPDMVEMTFDRIMPAVAAGEIDAGLIIHESRFTYNRHGLISLIDLGDWWERETGSPIPLGGIVAHRRLGQATINAFDKALAESVTYAWAHRNDTVPFMLKHAQEMEPDVMNAHVDLYVNRFTQNLGEEGRKALEKLAERAKLAGVGRDV